MTAPEIRKRLVFGRLLFSRGSSWINTIGIGWVTASKLYDQLRSGGHPVPFLAIGAIGMILIISIGFLEWRLGFWTAESKIVWEMNPDQKRLTDKPSEA